MKYSDMKSMYSPTLLLIVCCTLFSAFNSHIYSQVTLAFQGGETGDSWTYTSTGASALSISEATQSPNKITGNTSLVVGGNTGGGNCFDSGSGNGPNTPRTFTFDPVNITTSNESTRTLRFNWGNRFPACNGTGWDAGENLVFTAYYDGVAQPSTQLATGNGNAQFDIQANQHIHQIPSCVNSFYFTLSVTTNRADELLFIDDVILTAPQLNATTGTLLAISGPTTMCPGETVTLTSNYASGISWSTGETTPSIDVTATGTYTLNLTTSCGVISVNHTITSSSSVQAVITPNGPTDLCPGESVTLTSSNTTGNTWSNGETTQSIVVNATGTYTLTVNNSCGTSSSSQTVTMHAAPNAQVTPNGNLSFCSGDSLLLTASGGDSYLWSNGATDAAIYVHTGGNYSVTVTTSCGSEVSSTVNVTVLQSPSAQITGNTTFCEGDSLLLTASGGDSYQWSNGATGTSIYVHFGDVYTVTAFNSCGQAQSTTHTVTMFPAPQAQISGEATFCEGDSAQLTASGGANYLWSTGETTTSIFVHATGNYTVLSGNNCGQILSAPFTVAEIPFPSAQINGNLFFCSGESTTLTASGGTNYQWSNGVQNASITVSTAGNYTVTANNVCGQDQTTVTVTESTVDATFTATPMTGSAPLPVSFFGPAGDTYLWNFGDGNTSTGTDPEHLYTAEGIYTVTLITTNAQGCTATSSLEIAVLSLPSMVEVPNVFTPNGDGANDLFAITSANLEKYQLQIFNRWGNLLLEQDDPTRAWDGTIHGDPAVEGTYFYKIEATGLDQQRYELSGYFDLIR